MTETRNDDEWGERRRFAEQALATPAFATQTDIRTLAMNYLDLDDARLLSVALDALTAPPRGLGTQ